MATEDYKGLCFYFMQFFDRCLMESFKKYFQEMFDKRRNQRPFKVWQASMSNISELTR